MMLVGLGEERKKGNEERNAQEKVRNVLQQKREPPPKFASSRI